MKFIGSFFVFYCFLYKFIPNTVQLYIVLRKMSEHGNFLCGNVYEVSEAGVVSLNEI